MKDRSSIALTGAKLLYNALVEQGIKTIFGIPGSDVLPFYDEIYKSDKIKHYLVRHEQAAVHAADGYWRASGRLAATIGTSGPGSTNQVTGIAAAYADSIPFIALTLNTSRKNLGKGVFQEVDIVKVVKPITKKAFRVMFAKDISHIVNEAISVATNNQHGPVLIDIPKDILKEIVKKDTRSLYYFYNKRKKNIISSQTNKDINKTLDLLKKSYQPIFLVGEGIIASDSVLLFRKIARKLQIPVATTVSGAGIIPENDELSLQVAGVLGTPYANSALQEADVVFALGISLETRTTANAADFAKKAKLIHIDFDDGKCGKFVQPYRCIHTDVKMFLEKLLDWTDKNEYDPRRKWLNKIDNWKKNCPITYKNSKVQIRPQKVIETLYQLAPNALVFAGNGQHKYWAMRHFTFTKPRQFNVNSRFGCMGFAFPAAIGAKIARPKEAVVTILGDGDFQMNIAELATAVENKINLKIIIINNRTLGAIYQHQHFTYGDRYFGSYYDLDLNFANVARAYGVGAVRITKPSQVKPALQEMLEARGAYLIDVIIPKNEYLLPKISASDPLDKAACLIDFDANTGEFIVK